MNTKIILNPIGTGYESMSNPGSEMFHLYTIMHPVGHSYAVQLAGIRPLVNTLREQPDFAFYQRSILIIYDTLHALGIPDDAIFQALPEASLPVTGEPHELVLRHPDAV